MMACVALADACLLPAVYPPTHDQAGGNERESTALNAGAAQQQLLHSRITMGCRELLLGWCQSVQATLGGIDQADGRGKALQIPDVHGQLTRCATAVPSNPTSPASVV